MEPIQFLNRYTGEVETEVVYGEGFLNWTYNNPFGKLPLHLFVKRGFFSKWYGSRMDHPKTKEKVAPFIEHYKLDANDFIKSAEEFEHFNDFFYRKLKPAARPISDVDVVFPADGRHLGFEKASAIENFFVKGQEFNLKQFLNDDSLYQIFKDGPLVLSRLCPVDYHRYHFPAAGKAHKGKLINGPLYSVSPIALRKNLSYLWENKREVTILETANLGKVAIVEIGATCVGSIHQSYKAGSHVEKGQEKGYFSFGGSSVITLFEPGRIKLDADLVENSAIQRELYACIGDSMASII
ncbi:phosphatidylserine decarboxylase [Akkermansiaceae bacterium]|nr:phosphatidylserine decarboxylase [Akkermansiaceae bacterium]